MWVYLHSLFVLSIPVCIPPPIPHYLDSFSYVVGLNSGWI